MDVERFWAIVAAADGDVEEWSPDLDEDWAHALYAHLATLPADEVLDFDLRLAALRRAAATPEMAGRDATGHTPTPDHWIRYWADPYHKRRLCWSPRGSTTPPATRTWS